MVRTLPGGFAVQTAESRCSMRSWFRHSLAAKMRKEDCPWNSDLCVGIVRYSLTNRTSSLWANRQTQKIRTFNYPVGDFKRLIFQSAVGPESRFGSRQPGQLLGKLILCDRGRLASQFLEAFGLSHQGRFRWIVGGEARGDERDGESGLVY